VGEGRELSTEAHTEPREPATTEPPVLRVSHLRVATAAGDILRGVDFEVARNEIAGLLGESGCGKTTLALAIAGLLRGERRVVGGSIALQGDTVVKPGVDRTAELRGSLIGFVPQDPFSALDPLRRIGPQVGRGLVLKGMPRPRVRARVIEMLAAMGMPDPDRAISKYPHELSGGQRQRAVIAAALLSRPPLVVADEPTSALDVVVQAQVLDAFVELARELGTAVLFVTHDIGIVAEVCQRVAVMYAGRIVEYGPTPEVVSTPRHPYVAGLLASVPRLDSAPTRRLPSIGGQPPHIPGELAPCAFAPRCWRDTEVCWTVEPLSEWPGESGFACHHPLGPGDRVEGDAGQPASRRAAGPPRPPDRTEGRSRRPIPRALVIGLVLFGAILAVSLSAPLLPLRNPDAASVHGLAPDGGPLNPNGTYLLGTDFRGRDELSRLVYGGRVTFLAATVAVAVATGIGLTISLLAAGTRGWLGGALMRVTDIGIAIPALLLAATLGAVLGPGIVSLTVALAAVFWAPIARVTYGQAIVVRERPFLESARALGESTPRIMFREALPHVLPVTIAYAALAVGWAALFESALGFLGVGIQEPTASIGAMIGSGLPDYQAHFGLVAFPTLYLGLLVAATTLIGEGLRQRYDRETAGGIPEGSVESAFELHRAAG
jgi:oligopeptide/dipeptide ABC transporter ATP-binding protein